MAPSNLDMAPPPGDLQHEDHEHLIIMIQEHAAVHGYAVVKLRSKKSKTGKLYKIHLCCDRGRPIREPQGHKREHTSSRRNDCPFTAVIQRSTAGGELTDWRLDVKNPAHNHKGLPLIAHPSQRKLAMTNEKRQTIAIEFKKNQTAANIATGLRLEEDEEEPTFVMRDIYNEKSKVRRENLGGFTLTQALLKWLQKAN